MNDKNTDRDVTTLPVRMIPADQIAFLGEDMGGNHGRELCKDEGLFASLDGEGVKLPLIVHPSAPGTPEPLEALDGNRRLAWAKSRRRAVPCLVSEKRLSRAEARKLKVTLNNQRKNLTLRQLGAEIAAHIEETGQTQHQAAAFFCLSPPTVSRALNVNNMDPSDLDRMEAAGVPCSSVALIGQRKKREHQLLGMDFASTPGQGGGLPSRAELELFLAKLDKKGGRPAKHVEVAFGATISGLTIRADGDVRKAMEEAKGLLSLLKEHEANGIEAVIAILKARGKDRPAA